MREETGVNVIFYVLLTTCVPIWFEPPKVMPRPFPYHHAQTFKFDNVYKDKKDCNQRSGQYSAGGLDCEAFCMREELK